MKEIAQVEFASDRVLIFVEQESGEIAEVSLELISEGRRLGDALGKEVVAVTFGEHDSSVVEVLASYGADFVDFIASPLFSEHSIELYEEALFELMEEKKPGICLFGSTLLANDLAARLAARLKTGLVSDCIALSLNQDGRLLQTKLTHGGKIAATMTCPFSRPQMATVKPGVLEKRKPVSHRKAAVRNHSPDLGGRKPRFQTKGVWKADPEKIGLDEAEIIVSGGRGMGNPENFELLAGLASSLGGVVGASLGAVDEGLATRKNLVGQTGWTVKPKLYVACGISGSIYHVLGMKDSELIIAINKDRSAPIFKYSDMGVVGDAVEIISATTGRLKKR